MAVLVKLILHEPEIPPNTGNIARLCAAFNVELHLVEPLGFSLDNRYLKRAGLDYWPNVQLVTWPCWSALEKELGASSRFVMATSHGNIKLQNFHFSLDDAIVMGSETKGLPAELLELAEARVRIPHRTMENGGARCLNLSTAAGIFLFTALNSCGIINNFD